LVLAHSTCPGVEAATVDHGLRPEAATEAQRVAEICAQIGIPHAILHPAAPPKGNVSAWARQARYAALETWRKARQLDHLATAHHADDQLETLLMRLNRGAGVAGLAGIRARQGRVLRPLLGWTKADLQALVHDMGLPAVDDPSNRDDRFDRARLRKALAGVDWLDPRAAVRSADALAQADAALDWAVASELGRRQRTDVKGRLQVDVSDLPQAIQLRLLLACLRLVAPKAAPRDDEVRRLSAALMRGGTHTLAGVKCGGGRVWTFETAPPPRPIGRNS
jgi:tRNA(Ile)-lysidine synthase